MKHWTHDELHEIADGNPAIKERLDKVHAIPNKSLLGLADTKKELIKIYAKAMGCEQLDQANDYLNEVISHINKKCKTYKVWRKYRKSENFHHKLTELKKQYKAEKKCHSPAGNDFVCYCK